MNHQDPHAPESASKDDVSASAAISAKGAARRRFARAGLGGTGIVLTLVSKPGMAATCASASGFASGPKSSHSPATACTGKSPGYWHKPTREWEKANVSPYAVFGQIFSCPSSHTAPLANYTLLDILNRPGGPKTLDADNVARHIIAAFLNARTLRVLQLPESEVFEIWNSYASTKTYTVAGKTWNGADIVIYLESTMDGA